MGWSIGEFEGRDIGYGVPARCDHPECTEKIDRGLSYVCGGQPYGGAHGCGLFFCSHHLTFAENEEVDCQLCERCAQFHDEPEPRPVYFTPFEPSPDLPEWINHKLTHESWQQWRDKNPDEVKEMQESLKSQK